MKGMKMMNKNKESNKLILEGSQKAFEYLQELWKSGELNELLGVSVLDLEVVSENQPTEEVGMINKTGIQASVQHISSKAIDIVMDWAMKIAEAVDPDEIDLALIMVDEFIKGGENRKKLFQRSKVSVVGAFGSGDIFVVFPWILRSITTVAKPLLSVLSSDSVDNFLLVIKDELSKGEKIQAKQHLASLSEIPYAPLKKVINTISSRLQESGLSAARCDLITYRVLLEFLEDPNSAFLFVQRLEES